MFDASLMSCVCALAAGLSFGFATGCEKKADAPASKPAATSAAASASGTSATAKPASGHDDHDHEHGDDHDHGPTTQLGEQTVRGFTVKASRDGDIKPGGDAPIDVWVTGDAAKVNAVRFWVGTEDAKGSVKAKAALEKDHWHTHAEIPNPLPQGSKLWVEIETDKGEKISAGFDLKA